MSRVVLRSISRSLWLSPALPVMAMVRLGAALGRPMATCERLARALFTSTRTPRSLRGYEPHERDVFITTFAKSGTNWAMQIAQQIAYRGRAEFDHIHDLVPWPEANLPAFAKLSDPEIRRRSPTGWRVIKTHLTTDLMPYHEQVAYITVLRDPKEVIVSAYYFILGVFGLLDRISFDEWYERWMRGNALSWGWADHAAGYWAWRDRPNVLVLSYADMKADLPAAVARIADLMRVPLSDDERAEVTRRSGFAHMKEDRAKFAPPRLPLRGSSPMPDMIRRGRAGGGDELLTRDRMAAIDHWYRERLRARGSDLPYDQLFARA